MGVMGDIAEVKKERIENLSDEEIKSIYVRKELFHMISRNTDNFYDSGMYDELMEESKTTSDPSYGHYIRRHLSSDILDELDEKVHAKGEYDSVMSFLFDHITKDSVTADDAREKMKRIYAETSGTPGDEITNAVIGIKRNDEIYTIRNMKDVTGDFKLYKGDMREGEPDKRATRVGNTKKPLFKYVWEKAAEQETDILVFNEQEDFTGQHLFYDVTFIPKEKAKRRT